jgi:predicted nucleic acid-binding protein
VAGRILLDTSAAAALLRGDQAVIEKLESSDEVYTSIVVVGELLYGARHSTNAASNLELNRRIMQEQIIERDAQLFQDVALEQFLVVAPGGRVENKADAVGGVDAWNAESIEIRDEQVVFQMGGSSYPDLSPPALRWPFSTASVERGAVVDGTAGNYVR